MELYQAAWNACGALEDMRDSPETDYFSEDADNAICDLNRAFRNKAEVNLLRAAPELLEALRAMLDAFHEDPLEANKDEAVTQAYDAIDKALGRT